MKKAMRRILLSFLIVVAVTTLTTKLSAQNPIPSFNIPVVADPTTFEESPVTSPSSNNYFEQNNPFSQRPMSRGERWIYVETIDTDDNTTASVSFNIYSLNETHNYGPYSVNEGSPFTMQLSETEEWGLKVNQSTLNAEMSVWFE
jgi:hypothetical protein